MLCSKGVRASKSKGELEIKESIKQGAHEIDIVISRRHVLHGNWKKLYDEVTDYRNACGNVCLKTILLDMSTKGVRFVNKINEVDNYLEFIF